MKNPRAFLIGGEWRESGQVAQIRSPYSGEIVAEVYQASEKDLEDAVTAAARGFRVIRELPAYRRTEILTRLLALMEMRAEELIETMVLEGGKARKVAQGEFARAKETIRISSEEARRIGGEIVPIDWSPAGESRQALVRRFPVGIVLGISPFNYPLNLSCHKLGPAVAAGNSFILKPASATPLSGLLLGEMALEAGCPPEALSVVVCPGSRAERLVSDPRIAFFTFTGSSEVGWHLKGIAGRKRVGLELGGNAAAIVHEDADLRYAAGRIVMGGFTNAGQNCISVQRVLLHRPIYDSGLSLLIERTKSLKVGDPRDPETDVGPMIDRPAAEKAMARVQEALQGGAKALIGGRCEGTMFEPTILVETRPDMIVNREEIFAPVITVAPYDDFDQAIAMANDTDFGLQSGIFTQDIQRILHAFDRIEVGGLQINDVSTFRVDQMPYGGVKGSGIGREGPRYAVEEMTEARLMVINLASGGR